MSSIADPEPPRMRGFYRLVYRPLDRATTLVEQALLLFCSLAILVAMVLTTVDVFLRYGFSRPLGWSFDFVMLYMMPAAYYMAFSYAMRIGAHLSVDFFATNLPRAMMRVVYPALLLLSAALVLFIGSLIAEEAAESLRAGETLFGSIRWLTWPTSAIISLSFLALAVRLLLVACRVVLFGEGVS